MNIVPMLVPGLEVADMITMVRQPQVVKISNAEGFADETAMSSCLRTL